MAFSRGSALALLVLCTSLTVALAKPTQLGPGIIPIPDDPPAPAPAALPTALARPTAAAYPGYGAAAAAAPAPAAAGLGYPATTAGYGAAPAADMTAAIPAAGYGAAAGYGTPAALPAATPGFPTPGFPAATPGYPSMPPGFASAGVAVPAAGAYPGAMPAAMPTAMPAAMPGAMPGMMPGLPGAFGPMLPPGMVSSPGMTAMPAPPPRARPAAPPAPPIPRGKAVWKPQWDELKDFTDNEVIVSFNVANTPEQIYWNQRKVREALAKAGGILPNSISYHQVLPSTDDYGRTFTTVRFVVQNKNADLASNLMTSLNAEGTQNKLKNRIEELNLDLIGDTMKAQTPTDFKATSRGAALPSSTMMDNTGGMNAAGALAPGRGGPLGPDSPGAAGLPTAKRAGNATSTAGLPGLNSASKMSRRERSAASSAAAGGLFTAAAVLSCIMLL